MKKGIISTISFLLFIAVFSAGTLFSSPRSFSENENRPLASFPEITAESTLSGEAQAGLNTYFSDQLIGRDFLVSLKSTAEKLSGMRESGGVYFGRDGYYIKKLEKSDKLDANFKNNLAAVNTFFEKNKKLGKKHMSFILAPTASGVLKNKMPAGNNNFIQKPMLEEASKNLKNGTFIPLFESFRKNDDEVLYYKTDHHWTTYGAYLAYKSYCDALGKKAKKYEAEIISEAFRGTLYSKAPYFGAPKDTVELFRLKNEASLSLYIDGKKQSFSVYDRKKAEGKDKYKVFFGDNYPEMKLENKKGKGNLLVIKDSYANAFLPFIAEDFKSITVIDPRYYTEPISKLIEKNKITDITVLYNIESFSEDNYLPLITL